MAKRGPKPKQKYKAPRPRLARSGMNDSIVSDMVVKAQGTTNLVDNDFFETDMVSRFPTEIRNPTLNPEMFFLPKFTSNDGSPNIELNTWYDHYYRFDPLIGNLLDLHSTLPISRFGLVGINDSTILKEYEQEANDLELFENASVMLHNYFRRGEFLAFAKWDEDQKTFTALRMLDTNLLTVTGHPLLIGDKKNRNPQLLLLEPDEYLQLLVTSTDEYYKNLVDEYLDPEIRMAIENGFQLLLDPFSGTFHCRKVNPWDLRGTSILCNILKTLILEDKLREYQYSNAQTNTTPMRIWHVGNQDYVANEDDIAYYTNLITNLSYDPQKNIIEPNILKCDVIGAQGQTDKLFQDFQYIENQKLTALWANKAFTHSEGITYNSSSVAMRVLMGRYLPIRSMIENVFYRKIFYPIALAREYYKRTSKNNPNGLSAMIKVSKGTQEPLLPIIDWRHKQSLMDDTNVRSMLVQLRDKGAMPMKVICDSLDLDYEYVMKWIDKERNSSIDPDLLDIRKMLLKSAAGEGLKDTGEKMMIRVTDAATAFDKALKGYSSNIETKEKDKNKEYKDEPDWEETQEETTEEKPEQKKEKKIISKEYIKAQKENISEIHRRYGEEIKEQLKNPKSFRTVYSNTDIVIKALKDNYYDNEVIGILTEQLYDNKILLADAGRRYIHDKTAINENKKTITAQKCLNNVLDFNKKEYIRRLKRIAEITVRKIGNELGKKLLDKTELMLIDLEPFKYAIAEQIKEIEVTDEQTLKYHWNTVFAKVKDKIIQNVINLIREKELQCYAELDIKQVYFNDEIKNTTDEFTFGIKDRLVPKLDYKFKKTMRLKKFTAEQVPYELRYKVVDLYKKYNIRGRYDFKDETIETVNDSVLNYHLGYLFDNLNNYNDLIDLESRFNDRIGTDEKEFFVNEGKKYLLKQEQKEQVKDYFKIIF